MANRVGTSGWSRDVWKGRFHPDDPASGDMLSSYAAAALAQWAAGFTEMLEEAS